jgi:response regulator of citrate/malate metabolism
MIKLLIVEDDPMVVEITKEFVKEDPDFEVVGAANTGLEAVEQTKELSPQLILLDNFLPDFNGTAVIDKVRAFNKQVDFIMITAAKEVPIVQECMRLGVRDYLIKPFLKQRFLQSLHNYRLFLDALNKTQISQSDLDKINSSIKNSNGINQKGFSDLTQEKIFIILKSRVDGITAEEIASEVGISVVSARRYLKVLHQNKTISCDLIYGKQGRPTHIYYLS